jgi:uncharacterized OB-fold protein
VGAGRGAVTVAVRPVPDELSDPFWDGARQHRLVLRRCRDCGRYQHPPRVLCPWCAGPRHEYREVPGEGRVHSHTTLPGPPELTVLVVELDLQDGLLLVGSVPGPHPEWARIGAPVRTWFEHVAGDDDLVLPQFAPAGP